MINVLNSAFYGTSKQGEKFFFFALTTQFLLLCFVRKWRPSYWANTIRTSKRKSREVVSTKNSFKFCKSKFKSFQTQSSYQEIEMCIWIPCVSFTISGMNCQLQILFQLFLYMKMFTALHIVWKLLKMSRLNFGTLAISTNFCPITIDLWGNTVWPQASGFQKLVKMDHFWHF